MNPPSPDASRLVLLLQSRGLMGARELAQALEVSQPTLSRLIAQLGPQVERVGAARSTRYGWRRPIRHLGSQWPLYRIGADGRPQTWGELRAVHGGFRFVPRDTGGTPAWMDREYPAGVFSGLPFFLQDIGPRGYLGRAIAREAAPHLGVPTDPGLWQDDDLVSYLVAAGDDLPGDLVLGDRALERALRRADAPSTPIIAEAERADLYPQRAAAAQRGELVGSSAGGEQPKFLERVRPATGPDRAVLVKFSAADDSPVRQRWADLLLCEHLASEILRTHRIDCVRTVVLDGGGRRFLEVERFDRTAADGRRGLLTLGALEDAFVNETSADWVAAADRLERAGWLDPDGARSLRWIWCFGDLIANSDMHRSNASVWFADEFPFRLAPFYDILPMLFAPGAQGELGERAFSPRPPLPAVTAVWAEAAAVAMEFWDRVAADVRISNDFRAIAQRARATVQGLRERFA